VLIKIDQNESPRTLQAEGETHIDTVNQTGRSRGSSQNATFISKIPRCKSSTKKCMSSKKYVGNTKIPRLNLSGLSSANAQSPKQTKETLNNPKI